MSMLSFQFILKRSASLPESGFHVSRQALITQPLLIGAGLFGMGWGMTGYCLGSTVASLGLFSLEGAIMVAAIYAGFFSQCWLAKK